MHSFNAADTYGVKIKKKKKSKKKNKREEKRTPPSQSIAVIHYFKSPWVWSLDTSDSIINSHRNKFKYQNIFRRHSEDSWSNQEKKMLFDM